MDFRFDVVTSAVILDCLPAWRNRKVIDDRKTAGRQHRIKRFKAVRRRLIHIAVQPDQGEWTGPQAGQGVTEQAFDEDHLVIQKVVDGKVGFNLRLINRQLAIFVQPASPVSRKILGVRRWQTVE